MTAAEGRRRKTPAEVAFNVLATVGGRADELFAFIVPFAIFTLSVNHHVASWDTAEMQGVPYILGIAHPTGFPLYALLGYAFSHTFAVDTVAFRLNVFSACCVAGACIVLYSTARTLSVPRVCALVAAWWFAVGSIVWNHAIRAEVHDLALLLGTVTLYLFTKWVRNGGSGTFLLGTAACGLGLATHPICIWLIPGIVTACFLRRPERAHVILGLAILGGCLSLYLYLPLRSLVVLHQHLDPTVGLAGQHGALFRNLNNPSTWSGFLREVSGSEFGAGHTVLSAINAATLQSYLWDWLTLVNSQYGAFALVVAFIGLSRLWLHDWRLTITVLAFSLASVPFSYAYAVEGDSERYRMLSLWAVPLFMAGAAVNRERLNSSILDVCRLALVAALMLLWASETFANNRGILGNSAGFGNQAFITEAAARVPAEAIVLTPWMDATTLAYGAYVDHTFDHRIVIAGWPNGEERHFGQWLRIHPTYVIWNSKPNPYRNVEFIARGSIDNYNTVWQVVPAASVSGHNRFCLRGRAIRHGRRVCDQRLR